MLYCSFYGSVAPQECVFLECVFHGRMVTLILTSCETKGRPAYCIVSSSGGRLDISLQGTTPFSAFCPNQQPCVARQPPHVAKPLAASLYRRGQCLQPLENAAYSSTSADFQIWA